MLKQQPIPTLKSDSYHPFYFKHEAPPSPIHSLAPDYFEINHRCIWSSSIKPHRLDFYMLFIVTQGEGTHTFGSREYQVSKNRLCFVGPDMIRSWHASMENQAGYFVGFSESFFNHGFEKKRLLNELPFFQMDGEAMLSLEDEQMNEFLYLFKQMHQEYHYGNAYSKEILRTQLQLIIYKASAQIKTAAQLSDSLHDSRLRLVRKFKALFLRDFHSFGSGKKLVIKKISEYADELAVSQNHLNDTVKEITGKSAGQLLRHQVIHQATSCLLHADKTVSEIAFALGFDDPSYFSRFYKNQTGQSPTEFREANTKL